jgi:hypothetical protein
VAGYKYALSFSSELANSIAPIHSVSVRTRTMHTHTHTHKNTRYMDTRSLRASIVCDPEKNASNVAADKECVQNGCNR